MKPGFFRLDPHRRRSRRRLALLVVAAAFAALNLVTFAAFTWRKLTEVRRAEARATEVEERLRASEGALAVARKQSETIRANERDIAAFKARYLKDLASDLLDAQREIDALARASGISAPTTSYTLSRVKGTDLVRCAVGLPVEGSYRNLIGLIERVESSPRFLTLADLALSSGESKAQLKLEVSAYFIDDGSLRGVR
jgi:Tfp pilus assembly protein PilO